MTTMNTSIPCHLCQSSMVMAPCQLSERGKRSLQLYCPRDRKHFRGLIAAQPFVDQVLVQLGVLTEVETTLFEDAAETGPAEPPEARPDHDLP